MKKLLSLILVAIMLVTAMPLAFAKGNTYKVGDIVQFGSYPQSKVTDEALIAELNALAPEWDYWTSYGYYSGDGGWGTMTQGDWMRYIDIEFKGEKYRGVKFTKYRPYRTNYDNSNSYSYQDIEGYTINTAYWFNFEELSWKILEPETGLILCENIIDAQSYSNTYFFKDDEFFNDSTYENYASDYATSSIRKWLNEDFYNTAFNYADKKEIKITYLENVDYCSLLGYTGCEKYASENTSDKIFLLSTNEALHEDFGFVSNSNENDNAKITSISDYANCQGLPVYYVDTQSWILRTPYCSDSISAIDNSGKIGCYLITVAGIRPALRLNKISDTNRLEYEHSTVDVLMTYPTCTEKGYKTFFCDCGDSYTSYYLDKGNHIDYDDDTYCDNCGYQVREKSFFEKISDWFKNLFDKLFSWLK